MFGYLSLAAVTAGFFAYFHKEAYAPVRVRRFDIPLVDLPPEWDGACVLHLTDIHARDLTRDRPIILNLLDQEPVAAVFVTGDLFRRGDRAGGEAVLSLLHAMTSRAPVYFVSGNHDYPVPSLADELQSLGVIPLYNDHVRLSETLYLVGVEDPQTRRADLDGALEGVPPHAFVILLAHSPRILPAAVRRGIPLLFAGHTHGGQGRIPFKGALWVPGQRELFPTFDRGLFRVERTVMWLSSGMGISGPPFRFLTPPEVCRVRLRREASESQTRKG